MHCASLGEFEQGRPIIEAIKLKYPTTQIILTFFSPSGYEVQKNYTGADWVFYLPMDNASNASKFLDIVNPSMILFVKYEFWLNYLFQLKKQNIPARFLIKDSFTPKTSQKHKNYTIFLRNRQEIQQVLHKNCG